MRLISILLAFFLWCPSMAFSDAGTIEKPLSILLLHSYSETQSWTFDENEGFLDVLTNSDRSFDITVEYMDTKRYYSDAYFETFSTLFDFKHANKEYDIIAVTDDNALRFILPYKESYFKDTPLFFCGVNALNNYDFSKYDDIYGIREKTSIEETIKNIQRLEPTANQFYFLFDDSNTAVINIQDIVSRMNVSFPQLSYEIVTAPTLEDMQSIVSSITDPDSVFIYGFFMIDEGGIAYEPNYGAQIIVNSTDLSTYGLWTFSMDTGVIGGKLVSGYEQGKNMGDLLLRYLNDEVESNFLDSSLGNKFIYDYEALRKQDLDVTILQQSITFLNKPESFFERHQRVLLASFGIALALVLYIVTLRIQIKRKTQYIKKTTSHLMEYRRQASLNHLIKGVAHDINTPVGNIVTITDFIKRIPSHVPDYHSKINDAVQRIEIATEQINTLINQFRNISTEIKDTSFVPGKNEHISINQLIDEIASLALFTVGQKIDFQVTGDMNVFFPISREHLNAILEPLIDNSIEHGFIDNVDGRIQVDIHKLSDGIQLIYSDNGTGIRDDITEQIFEPFFSTAKHLKHSGLGLFGSKNTVTAYCGTIEFQQQKEGATFVITFPYECSIL